MCAMYSANKIKKVIKANNSVRVIRITPLLDEGGKKPCPLPKKEATATVLWCPLGQASRSDLFHYSTRFSRCQPLFSGKLGTDRCQRGRQLPRSSVTCRATTPGQAATLKRDLQGDYTRTSCHTTHAHGARFPKVNSPPFRGRIKRPQRPCKPFGVVEAARSSRVTQTKKTDSFKLSVFLYSIRVFGTFGRLREKSRQTAAEGNFAASTIPRGLRSHRRLRPRLHTTAPRPSGPCCCRWRASYGRWRRSCASGGRCRSCRRT